MWGLLIEFSVPQGADTHWESQVSPYDPDRLVENHLRSKAAGSNIKARGTQCPINQILFQNPQRSIPGTAGPTN